MNLQLNVNPGLVFGIDYEDIMVIDDEESQDDVGTATAVNVYFLCFKLTLVIF
jgi:hypothetical protein